MSRQFTRDALLEIARGNVSGIDHVNKFGFHSDIDNTEEEIWDGSVAYTWPASASITHVRAAADSATTRGMVLEVQGLDTNWALSTEANVTLDGTDSTTEVALGTALRRVFRIKVTDGSVADQNIWAGPTGFATQQAVITAGNNQTLMAIYTVPASKKAYVTNYYATSNKTGGAGTAVEIKLWARDNQNSYAPQLKHVQGLATGTPSRLQHTFSPYYDFGQKTDIYIMALGDNAAANLQISAGFDLILVDD